LQNNRIGPSGLQHICSALTINQSIKYLDIRDNMIQDESLKILLAMLFRNKILQNIKYSVTNEDNIRRL
jgi:Ran GTPase-activating protein (RanGAP) involved in mRNA processing and transport